MVSLAKCLATVLLLAIVSANCRRGGLPARLRE
jgi:hypothetical protein